MLITQNQHAKLICPVMVNSPFCQTDKCAMWRWTRPITEISEWIGYEQGKKLEANGWKHHANNGAGGHCYERPYPAGERPGICAFAKP